MFDNNFFLNTVNRAAKEPLITAGWILVTNKKSATGIPPNVKVNTLIMTGENDTGSTVNMSKKLCEVINNSQLKVIKNGKHLCGIECADDVNMTIKNFIDQND